MEKCSTKDGVFENSIPNDIYFEEIGAVLTARSRTIDPWEFSERAMRSEGTADVLIAIGLGWLPRQIGERRFWWLTFGRFHGHCGNAKSPFGGMSKLIFEMLGFPFTFSLRSVLVIFVQKQITETFLPCVLLRVMHFWVDCNCLEYSNTLYYIFQK